MEGLRKTAAMIVAGVLILVLLSSLAGVRPWGGLGPGWGMGPGMMGWMMGLLAMWMMMFGWTGFGLFGATLQ